MIKPLLIALSAILVLPNFVHKDIQSQQPYNGNEKFSPQLSFINSIDKLEHFADAAAAGKNIPVGSQAYLEILENIVAHRFYNGFSHKTLSQDWLSAATDRVAGTGYSCLVTADEIMQHAMAASSQQAIVLVEILKRKNINSREIGFSHHVAVEAAVNGGWYLLDAAMEPTIKGHERLRENWDGHVDRLKRYYDTAKQPDLSYAFGTAGTAGMNKTNKEQAHNLKKLQAATGILSKILWVFPLLLLIAVKKRSFKMYAIKPRGKYVRMQPLRPVYTS